MLQWNSVSDDFINSPNAINEVGCIHTTQGYDLNYSGIILGNEITYDKFQEEIVIVKENYFDKNGKNSIAKQEDLKNFILNIYKTIMLRGIKGTYVYVCDANLREYFSRHIIKYKPVKLAGELIAISANSFENSVPLFDLKAAAGNFSDLQSPAFDGWVELPIRYKPSKDLFACRVDGESMNKVIPNGSICLFRKYNGGSRNGKIVLVEHSSLQEPEFGSGYTVKEYRSEKIIDGEQWAHQSIILKPLTNNPRYKNIEIFEDELNSLKVIAVFECVL